MDHHKKKFKLHCYELTQLNIEKNDQRKVVMSEKNRNKGLGKSMIIFGI